jgi:hypothetical protein
MLSDDELRDLESEAKVRGVTMSDLLRGGLDRELAVTRGETGPSGARRLA